MTQANINRSAASERAPLLSELGQALWGSRWQTDMARALGVNKRTVQHWAVGSYHPRADTVARLIRMLEDRQRAISELLSRAI